MLILSIFTSLSKIYQLLICVSDLELKLNKVCKKTLAISNFNLSFLKFFWHGVSYLSLKLFIDCEFEIQGNFLTIERTLTLLLKEHSGALSTENMLAGKCNWLNHNAHANHTFTVVINHFFHNRYLALLCFFYFLNSFLFAFITYHNRTFFIRNQFFLSLSLSVWLDLLGNFRFFDFFCLRLRSVTSNNDIFIQAFHML